VVYEGVKNPEPSYYSVIPASVRYDNTLSPGARLLYGELTALTFKRGYCWATNEYMAGLFDVSPRQIRRWVSELDAAGHIEVVLDDKRDRRILLPHGRTKMSEGGTKVSGGWDNSVRQGQDKNVLQNNTLPSMDPSLSNTEKKKSAFVVFWGALPSEMKKGKAQAMRTWNRLSTADRQLASSFLDTYLRGKKKDGTNLHYGSSYLGARPWEDEGWTGETAEGPPAAKTRNITCRKCRKMVTGVPAGVKEADVLCRECSDAPVLHTMDEAAASP